MNIYLPRPLASGNTSTLGAIFIIFHVEGLNIYNRRASEASETLSCLNNENRSYMLLASETLSGVYKFELVWYMYIYVYVISRVGVKFVLEISRLTVLLKINTMASLLFI